MRVTDWILVAAAAALVLVGPVMAFQEWRALEDGRVVREITGAALPMDSSFRAAWRLPLSILVFVVSVLGAYSCVRVLVDRAARVLSGRLVGLLLSALVVLILSYAFDWSVLVESSHVARAIVVLWAYPLAGVLLAGSVHRLAEVRDHFGAAARHRDVEQRRA